MKNDVTRNIIAKFIPVVLISAFALGACGIKGDLKTPPPLWGDKGQQAEPQTEDKPETDKQESNN
jgi:predicted small lipoprotein YifL